MRGRNRAATSRRRAARRRLGGVPLGLWGVVALGLMPLVGAAFPDKQTPATPPEVNQGAKAPAEGPRPWRLMRVSAYCPCRACCGRWADGVTASGHPAVEGVSIAADPALFAMGACVWLRGLGRRTVQDTGSAIVGPRLDLFFESHERALEFGVQWLEVRPC